MVGKEKVGLVRDLNPGPRAPEARIIPLDHQATYTTFSVIPNHTKAIISLSGLRWGQARFLICLYLKRVYLCIKFLDSHISAAVVAEWLRRWTWNPMGSARVGSNPANCEIWFCSHLWYEMSKISDLDQPPGFLHQLPKHICQVWGSNPRNLSIMSA